MIIKFTEWKSCMTDKPTKDGEYLVLGVSRHNEVFSGFRCGYTVEYGWNTHAGGHNKHAIDFADEFHNDAIYVWAEASVDEVHSSS